MKVGVNQRARRVAIGVAFLLGFSATSGAQEEDTRFHPGWIPSLAIHGGFTAQDQFSSSSSGCLLGGLGDVAAMGSGEDIADCIDTDQMTPATLRPSDDGTDQAVTPFVGGSVQILTPVLFSQLGGPRLFASAELMGMFPPRRLIASEGDPGTPAVPNTPPELTPESIPTIALVGVGSYTASEVEVLAFGARAGIAIPFRFMERTLWIKPSAAWHRFSIEVEGLVAAGLKDDLDPPPPMGSNRGFGDFLRIVELQAVETFDFNAVGPALELEMAVGRFGPFGASMFIDAAAYSVLGKRKVSLTATRTITPDQDTGPPPPRTNGLGTDTYSATFTHEVDKWLYRGGVGIRISWLGNRGR